MDVERIQKVNDLAINLMNQGLAQNRDEAIAQAEKIFKGEDTQDYNELKNTMEEVRSDQEPQQQGTSTHSDEPQLSQEDIKSILEKNTNFIVGKIREFQEKIQTMEKEIYHLRNKVNYREPVVREVVSNVPPPQQVETQNEVKEQQSAEPQQQEKPAQQQNGNHPRSGGYNDEDVSIEKFFYMGNQ